MSALAPNWSLLTTGAVALTAAFAGSLHCVAMCGPIRLLSPGTARARVGYQTGRALGYALLGAGAGFLGWSVPPLALVLGVAAAAALIAFRVSLPAPWRKPVAKLTLLASSRPFPLGLSSALLPCGLLHGWVAAAAATASPLAGATLLGALWLGTLPALELGSFVAARPIARLNRLFPRAFPIALLLVAAAPTIWRAHAAYAAGPSGQLACHHMDRAKPPVR